jgi:hypothetical protein
MEVKKTEKETGKKYADDLNESMTLVMFWNI